MQKRKEFIRLINQFVLFEVFFFRFIEKLTIHVVYQQEVNSFLRSLILKCEKDFFNEESKMSPYVMQVYADS